MYRKAWGGVGLIWGLGIRPDLRGWLSGFAEPTILGWSELERVCPNTGLQQCAQSPRSSCMYRKHWHAAIMPISPWGALKQAKCATCLHKMLAIFSLLNDAIPAGSDACGPACNSSPPPLDHQALVSGPRGHVAAECSGANGY